MCGIIEGTLRCPRPRDFFQVCFNAFMAWHNVKPVFAGLASPATNRDSVHVWKTNNFLERRVDLTKCRFCFELRSQLVLKPCHVKPKNYLGSELSSQLVTFITSIFSSLLVMQRRLCASVYKCQSVQKSVSLFCSWHTFWQISCTTCSEHNAAISCSDLNLACRQTCGETASLKCRDQLRGAVSRSPQQRSRRDATLRANQRPVPHLGPEPGEAHCARTISNVSSIVWNKHVSAIGRLKVFFSFCLSGLLFFLGVMATLRWFLDPACQKGVHSGHSWVWFLVLLVIATDTCKVHENFQSFPCNTHKHTDDWAITLGLHSASNQGLHICLQRAHARCREGKKSSRRMIHYPRRERRESRDAAAR